MSANDVNDMTRRIAKKMMLRYSNRRPAAASMRCQREIDDFHIEILFNRQRLLQTLDYVFPVEPEHRAGVT